MKTTQVKRTVVKNNPKNTSVHPKHAAKSTKAKSLIKSGKC